MRRKIWFAALVLLGTAAFVAAVIGLLGGVSSLTLSDMGAVVAFLGFLLYMVVRHVRKAPADTDEP